MDTLIITPRTVTELDQDAEMPAWMVEDLAAVHDFLLDQERETSASAFECARVRKAQEPWNWED